MNTWFLVLILTTPGQPSEHYVTIQTPDEQTCLILREHFVYAVAHADGEDEPGTPMVIVSKNCEPEEIDQ